MLIVGLTGSIAMGKSTVVGFFKNAGIPVIGSDEIVHSLYEGEAAPLIEKDFPGSVKNGQVDRQLLMQLLTETTEQQTKQNFEKLEQIVHPLVKKAQWDFLKAAKTNAASITVLDIPLLFETSAETMMDITVLASAPFEIQKKRALERPGMTENKFLELNAKQMSDEKKREKADFIIDTGCTLQETEMAVSRLIERLQTKQPTVYERWEEIYGQRNEEA